MQNANKQQPTAQAMTAPELTRRVRHGEAAYDEVMDFLVDEAHLLDEGRYPDWLELLAEDVVSVMPIRQSVHRAEGSGFNSGMVWTREDLGSLSFKARRLLTDSAFNEDPPSRTRRFVSNLRLHETAVPGEYFAQSYLLLRRCRGEAHVADQLSARRDDVLRRTAGGWKLARRAILMDQSVLGMSNLAIFL